MKRTKKRKSYEFKNKPTLNKKERKYLRYDDWGTLYSYKVEPNNHLDTGIMIVEPTKKHCFQNHEHYQLVHYVGDPHDVIEKGLKYETNFIDCMACGKLIKMNFAIILRYGKKLYSKNVYCIHCFRHRFPRIKQLILKFSLRLRRIQANKEHQFSHNIWEKFYLPSEVWEFKPNKTRIRFDHHATKYSHWRTISLINGKTVSNKKGEKMMKRIHQDREILGERS